MSKVELNGLFFVAQHYPLYRVSDAGCTGLDAAPAEDRHLLFREKYDVLSKEASQRVGAFSVPPWTRRQKHFRETEDEDED